MNLFVRFLVSKLHTGFRQLRMHIERRRKLHFEIRGRPKNYVDILKSQCGNEFVYGFSRGTFFSEKNSYWFLVCHTVILEYFSMKEWALSNFAFQSF